MGTTTTAELTAVILESKYATDLNSFIRDGRAEGKSFQRIARDLHDLTDGTISVTDNTIRNWFRDMEAVA